MNDPHSFQDSETACQNKHCYGVVKEYKYGGERDAPDEIEQQKNSITRKLKEKIYPLIGKDVKQITWYECSVCHEYYADIEEVW